jgi:hypothetical protein
VSAPSSPDPAREVPASWRLGGRLAAANALPGAHAGSPSPAFLSAECVEEPDVEPSEGTPLTDSRTLTSNRLREILVRGPQRKKGSDEEV